LESLKIFLTVPALCGLIVTIKKQGLGMRDSDVFATFGVPIFYVDRAITEDAGDGMTRIWNCATRNGVVIPQCEIITRASRLVIMATNVRDDAQAILRKEMLREAVH
jgi:hypothetical protein